MKMYLISIGIKTILLKDKKIKLNNNYLYRIIINMNTFQHLIELINKTSTNEHEREYLIKYILQFYTHELKIYGLYDKYNNTTTYLSTNYN